MLTSVSPKLDVANPFLLQWKYNSRRGNDIAQVRALCIEEDK